nr:hypothetical protein [Paraglaciecola sp. 20A4]
MKLREYFTQEVAASKASISVSTAGRIEANRQSSGTAKPFSFCFNIANI